MRGMGRRLRMSTSWGALCVMMRMWLLTVTSMLHREVSALMCVLQRKASRCLARRCGARYLMVCCERTSCSCFTITYICSLACFSNAMPSDMTHHAAEVPHRSLQGTNCAPSEGLHIIEDLEVLVPSLLIWLSETTTCVHGMPCGQPLAAKPNPWILSLGA